MRKKNAQIVKWIRYREKKLRKKFGFLRYQDQIGLSITLGAALSMIAVSVAFVTGFIPAWTCVFVNAILASLLHEIEHDTIHDLYFKKSPRVQNLLFWIVWLFRGNTVSPWYRKTLHTLHHKVSGHKEDMEERFIGNGMKPGVRRLLSTLDMNLSIYFQGRSLMRDAPRLRALRKRPVVWPTLIFFSLWYSFLLINLFYLINNIFPFVKTAGFLDSARYAINIAGFCYCLPNWIRQSSIQLVSSNMHYYGDVTDLSEQTQVLNSWLVLPFHLFCFNFGSTHGIHHFVINQPFYIRQAIARSIHPVLRKYGIRFNDWASMARANRFQTASPVFD